MKALDSGEIIVLGERLKPNNLPESCLQIGFMPQENTLYDEFTIEETLNFFGNIYQMEFDVLEDRKTLVKKLRWTTEKNFTCLCFDSWSKTSDS
jgi:ABC-type multidrug transport system ATPase subunit